MKAFGIASICLTLLAANAADGIYMSIDVSGGPTAESYPVEYLSDVPAGGWSDLYKNSRIVLRKVDPGVFTQLGVRQVTLTRAFYIGVFEITQKQYELVTGSNPSNWKGDMRPVELVNWHGLRGDSNIYNWPTVKEVDANSFIGKLRARTNGVLGDGIDIPTEAQWEYACRAGTDTPYYNGGTSESEINLIGRFNGNQNDGKGGGYDRFTTVGSYLPNAWGIYDMQGNLWEWVLDYYEEFTTTPVTDPVGPISGSKRQRRGGSWGYGYDTASSNYRGFGISQDDIGDNTVRICCNTIADETSPKVSNVAAKQHYPWCGKIDISYTVSGLTDGLQVKITVADVQNGVDYDAKSFAESPLATVGNHTVVWNAGDDGVSKSSTNLVATVSLIVP